MKKHLIVLAMLLIVISASAASADDTKVSLGLKMWQNKWETEIEPPVGAPKTFDNGSALMVGPSLNIRFPSQWFIGAAYLVSTQDYEAKDYFNAGDTMTFERKDLDFTLGYMFNSYFGLFVGYKSIGQDMTYNDPPSVQNLAAGTWELKGTGIGILGNIPLGETAAIYGSFALLSMKQNYQTPTGTNISLDDMAGASIEVGLAMAFTDTLSANIGIKSQAFSAKDEFETTTTESFAGLTAGLNFSF